MACCTYKKTGLASRILASIPHLTDLEGHFMPEGLAYTDHEA